MALHGGASHLCPPLSLDPVPRGGLLHHVVQSLLRRLDHRLRRGDLLWDAKRRHRQRGEPGGGLRAQMGHRPLALGPGVALPRPRSPAHQFPHPSLLQKKGETSSKGLPHPRVQRVSPGTPGANISCLQDPKVPQVELQCRPIVPAVELRREDEVHPLTRATQNFNTLP